MDNKKLVEMLKLHEGVRNKPYKCTAGKLTIGVGRNLDDVGLSDDEIEYLLKNDIERCKKDLDKNIPWWKDLDEVRQFVLVDMCFNLGIVGLMKFERTLKSIKAGKYEDAAKFMLESLWAKQVGKRATSLSSMMKKGA